MTHLRNDYANVLTEKTILYVPSCLIVEMLTKLYSQVATINLSGNLHNVTPDLLILLRRMRHNLRVTAEACEQGRIRHFIGDWRDDKLRARKLFFNTMSSLGYISELLERVERNMLFAAIESVTAEWTALDRLIDAGAEERPCPAGGVCERFCDCNSDAWRDAMAKHLLSVRESADGASADCLLLVCYTRAKRQLSSAVEDAARDSGADVKIDPDRIVSVSKERVPVICQKCVEPVFAVSGVPVSMPGGAGRIGAYELRAQPSRQAGHRKTTSRTAAAQPRRHVMPPSLASLCPGKD